MAIFVSGMPCGICGEPMESAEEVHGFPPFVYNQKDPLHLFSDGVFHKACLENHPLGQAALRRVQLHIDNNKPANRVCRITGEQITDPDDYFSLGYLTDNLDSELSKWNYAHFKKSSLERWSEIKTLIGFLEELRDSGEWEMSGINWIIDELKSFDVSTH